VKGLVDAGVTAVPRIFHHPPDPLHALPPPSRRDHLGSIPAIDLLAARAELVKQVKAAAETAGFFQVVNHGVPEAAMSEMLSGVRRFNEEPLESKKPYYTSFSGNYDLFQSPAASWRDTLFLEMSPPAGPSPEEVPPACRDVVLDYSRQVRRLASALFGLLSEAMGLHGVYLEHDAGFMDGFCMLAHYYPPCPEPHHTLGTAKHCDASRCSSRTPSAACRPSTAGVGSRSRAPSSSTSATSSRSRLTERGAPRGAHGRRRKSLRCLLL
jgi:2,4-dihydroxy-1,4-benzoxazin-3-one-glucoside dioxygenase